MAVNLIDFAHLHIWLLLKLESSLQRTRIIKFDSKHVQSIWSMRRPTASSNITDELTFSVQLSNHAINSKSFSSSVKGIVGSILSTTFSPIRRTRDKFPADIFFVLMMWLAMKALKATCCIVFVTHRQAGKSRVFRLKREIVLIITVIRLTHDQRLI